MRTQNNLYLNSAGDFTIEDDTHRTYSLVEARAAVESGQVGIGNLAMLRLVNQDYDLEKVKQDYQLLSCR